MLEAQLVNPINKFSGFKQLSLHILIIEIFSSAY